MRAVVRVLVTVLVLFVASLGSLAAVAPTAGAAPCLDCPGDPTTYDWQSTLTVSKTGAPATVTSTPAGISCGSVCSVVDDRTTSTPTRPTTGWPSYTLSAGSMPVGYVPLWSGCDSVTAGTCSVVNRSESGSVSVAIVDNTAPTVTFDPPAKVGPVGLLSAGGSDNSGTMPTFRWTVDSLPQLSTASSISIGDLAEGQHTVSVATRDASGNQSQAVTKQVVLDKSTSVEVGNVPTVTAHDFTWTFTPDADVPNDAAHRSCDVDGQGWTGCTAAASWLVPTADLSEASHIVSVRVTDDVGNTATIARTVVVDRTAPTVQFTGGPAEGASVTSSSIGITWAVSDANPGSITCRFDAASVPCGNLNNLALGQHAFAVTATDAAGNATTVTRHFSVVRTRTSMTAHPAKARTAKGHRVTLVARVSPSAATGTVTFKQGTKVLCRGTVRAGVAQCATGTGLARGLHRVKATYAGSSRYLPASATTSFRIV